MKPHLEELKEELEKGEALLIDVREVNEWNAGHLKKAILFPLSELQKGVFPSFDKQKKIYLHCRSGVRVHPARQLMNSMNFPNVIPLSEGFEELKQNGFEREN